MNRLSVLARAVQQQSGEWTTERVRRLYRAAGIAAPKRATARRDLARLTCRGVLVLHDAPARRYWTRNTATGGTR